MTNNLFVKFRKRALKLKKVVAIMTLRELSAANSRKKRV